MKPATQKQMDYAEDIAEELGIDIPNEHDMETISEFISDNVDDYFEARRERLGGYGEMEDRLNKRWRINDES